MTLTEIRDELARMDGWRENPLGGWDSPQGSQADQLVHPYPLTIDDAKRAMPEGVTWVRLRYIDGTGVWIAYPPDVEPRDRTFTTPPVELCRVPDTDNEIDDRYRLARAARVAGKEKDHA